MNNTNNDNTAEEQMVMLQALQAQMQELRQKDRRKQKEERRWQADEMAQLKEHNKRLLQRLEEFEREEHSQTPIPTPQTHQSRTKPPTLQTHGAHHASLTHPTHQSIKCVTLDKEENPRGHPFTDDIIVAPLPDKWRGLMMTSTMVLLIQMSI